MGREKRRLSIFVKTEYGKTTTVIRRATVVATAATQPPPNNVRTITILMIMWSETKRTEWVTKTKATLENGGHKNCN